jgi:hypothetical protein
VAFSRCRDCCGILNKRLSINALEIGEQNPTGIVLEVSGAGRSLRLELHVLASEAGRSPFDLRMIRAMSLPGGNKNINFVAVMRKLTRASLRSSIL